MNNQASFYLSEGVEFDEGKPEPSKKAIDTFIFTIASMTVCGIIFKMTH